MENIIKNIDEVVKRYPERASFFQLNFFVIGKEPTHQSRLRRCADELRVRRESIGAAEMELAEAEDRLELLRLDREDIQGGSKREEIAARRLDRRIHHSQDALEKLKARIRFLREEAEFLLEVYKKLTEHQPAREWDDAQVQLEYWNEKYARDIRERILLQLPIDIETVRCVLSLPGEAPVKKQVVQLLQKQDEKMIENKETSG
jgi:chromosome segregation ATPase